MNEQCLGCFYDPESADVMMVATVGRGPLQFNEREFTRQCPEMLDSSLIGEDRFQACRERAADQIKRIISAKFRLQKSKLHGKYGS